MLVVCVCVRVSPAPVTNDKSLCETGWVRWAFHLNTAIYWGDARENPRIRGHVKVLIRIILVRLSHSLVA